VALFLFSPFPPLQLLPPVRYRSKFAIAIRLCRQAPASVAFLYNHIRKAGFWLGQGQGTIMPETITPLVGVVMGSKSDWETMQHVCIDLDQFSVPYEKRIMSAHRTPEVTAEWARTARERGLEVLIAGAGGAAHLAGVIAAHTTIPVLGVPMQSQALNGMDSLLSTVQMPAGIPVATLAIGKAGATNAGLMAVAILSLHRPELVQRLEAFRQAQAEKVLRDTLD